MKIVDTNVLIYAVNESAPQHLPSRDWLDGALSGGSSVGFSWAALLGFIRLTTNPTIFDSPLTMAQATRVVDEWLAQSAAVVVEPTARHLSVLAGLLAGITNPNLVNDAHLAALAIEHKGVVVTYDMDFHRFAGVKVEVPR